MHSQSAGNVQPLFLNNVMLHGNRNKQIKAIFRVVGNEFTWQIYHAHSKKFFYPKKILYLPKNL